MPIDAVHHLVLKVPNLREAEQFYRELFDLDVLFREGAKAGEFGALPEELDWDAATDRGVEPGMSFLGRDAFALALMEAEGDADAGRLDHVALAVDAADRDAVRDRAAELDCEFEEKSDAVFVVDRYGVEWELNASSPPSDQRSDETRGPAVRSPPPETPFDTLDV